MPLVELVGPPTVGKTTLVAAAVRHGVLDARRVVLRARHPLLATPAAIAKRVNRPPLLRAMLDRLIVAPSDAEKEAALAAVAEQWAPYLELVLSGPQSTRHGRTSGPGSHTLGIMERYWLLAAVQLRALLEPARRRPETLLLDEGLTHPFKVRAAVGQGMAAAESYAEAVPLPDVLVVLDLDPRVLAERITLRHLRAPERVRWSTLGQGSPTGRLLADIETIRSTVKTVAARAESRGCHVIRLDATGREARDMAVRLVREVRDAVGR